MLIGVPFTVLQQILPFILVGIGIDDAFVISGAFDAVDPSLSIPDRIEKAMQRVGVSITLTKVTSISSFLLGATCVFPSVQYFCFYALCVLLLHLASSLHHLLCPAGPRCKARQRRPPAPGPLLLCLGPDRRACPARRSRRVRRRLKGSSWQ